MAKLTITVNVTQDDIDRGDGGNESNCPVALAVSRETGRRVRVNALSVEFENEEEAWLPRKASRFVCDFDTGKTVKPFTFKLEFGNRGY